MRWLLWGVLVIRARGGRRRCSARSAASSTPRCSSGGPPRAGLDDRRRRPTRLVSIEDLLGRTLVYGGLSRRARRRRPGRRRRRSPRCSATRSTQRAGRAPRAAAHRRCSTGRCGSGLAGVRRLVLGDRDNPYDVVAGLASTLESTDDGAGQLAAVARAVAAAFGVGFVSVEVDRGGGERLVATHGEPAGRDPHPADHLPRRGGRPSGAAGPRAAQPAVRAGTSGCSATWSARPRPPRAPAGSPRSCRTAASGWWSPARRSAAGSAATCTTGSGRRWAAWSSSSSRARLLVDSDPAPPRRQLVEHQRARAGRGGRRTPPGPRPAPARARRPRPGRRAEPAGRAAAAMRTRVDGRRPRRRCPRRWRWRRTASPARP